MHTIIIPSTTQAVPSVEFEVTLTTMFKENRLPISIWCWGLAEDEAIDIMAPTDLPAPNDWVTIYQLVSIAPGNQVGIHSPCRFKVVKPETNSLVGVAMTKLKENR
jgi:hypothetical protein